MIRRPPRSTPKPSSAASDVYKRQCVFFVIECKLLPCIPAAVGGQSICSGTVPIQEQSEFLCPSNCRKLRSAATGSPLGHCSVLGRSRRVPHPPLQEPGASQRVSAMILRMCHPKSTAPSLWNASGRGSICRMGEKRPDQQRPERRHARAKRLRGMVTSCRARRRRRRGR